LKMHHRSGVTTFQAISVVAIIVLIGAVGYFLATSPGTRVNTLTNTLTNTVTTTAPAFKGTINIGVLEPFTSFAAFYGPQITDGATLAAEEINAAGGVAGYRLNIVTGDEGSGGSQTINAYNELVVKDNASFIIGPDFSGDFLAIRPLMVRDHTIIISTSNSVLSLTQDVLSNYSSYKWYFRFVANDSELTVNGYNFLSKFANAKSLVFVGEDFLYVHEDAKILNATAQAHGVKVLATDFFAGDTLDYSSEVLKIAQLKPDAVGTVMTGSNEILFVKQLRQNPTTAKIPVFVGYSFGPLNTPSVVQDTESSQPGSTNNVVITGYLPTQAITPKTVQFYQNFLKRFGVIADTFLPAYSYDAVYVLANAIQKVGSLDKAAIVTALEQTHYTGVIGNIAFGKSHDLVYGPGFVQLPMVQILDTNYATIYPPSIVTGSYRPPG